MRLQMDLEDIFTAIAQTSSQHTIILFDSGVMDGSAYTDGNIWQAILDETGWSTIQLRDRRYEAVIHLVTAADGAEDVYVPEKYTAEKAREIDRRLIDAWVGHPSFDLVKNRKKGFQNKIDYCLKKVLSIVGMP